MRRLGRAGSAPISARRHCCPIVGLELVDWHPANRAEPLDRGAALRAEADFGRRRPILGRLARGHVEAPIWERSGAERGHEPKQPRVLVRLRGHIEISGLVVCPEMQLW
jgi:hypothetical protein